LEERRPTKFIPTFLQILSVKDAAIFEKVNATAQIWPEIQIAYLAVSVSYIEFSAKTVGLQNRGKDGKVD
jgi:hypothetical protein